MKALEVEHKEKPMPVLEMQTRQPAAKRFKEGIAGEMDWKGF